ncbi:hypothetical protein OROGR_002473 [Orobanche gracilis]
MEELADLNNGMKRAKVGSSVRGTVRPDQNVSENSVRESRLQLRILQQFSKQLEKLIRDSASAYIRSLINFVLTGVTAT